MWCRVWGGPCKGHLSTGGILGEETLGRMPG